MKNKLGLLLISSLAALTVAGVVLSAIILNNRNSDIKIQVNSSGETHQTLEINASGLYPGEKREFRIKLLYADAKDYRTSLSFVEIGSGGLRDFIVVNVVAGETSYSHKLSALLDGETVEFLGNADEIVLAYQMPIDVGNEAQGAKQSFKIELTISADGK